MKNTNKSEHFLSNRYIQVQKKFDGIRRNRKERRQAVGKKREITEEQVKEYQMLLAQWMSDGCPGNPK